jgi:hypothetical protein
MMTRRVLLKFRRNGGKVEIWTDEHKESPITTNSAAALARALRDAIEIGSSETEIEVYVPQE